MKGWPETVEIAGAAIIIGAGFYIFLREQQLGREETMVNRRREARSISLSSLRARRDP
jgi:hypothetical protein